ncbi:DUF1816 domain-containing protein [Leptolyngbya sp. FACHB-17]|uniref:DUF1816 domain-containing protein n=1 Tax=unclassified Leptolyngbya TaxID=2650499 RepID=UPI0016813BD1|nr:DUF1816 domain-containing protein [Leptolyngbya sp. FACHB-17]MBD2082568.1 DUF1816 domain-containing protein [Leptolyngbya sp. FACHB-17]
MNELLTGFLSSIGLAWWVEITTDSPRCVYYFGPFPNKKMAQSHQSGYLEDLEREGATNIKITVKRCKPSNLTIYDEKADVGFNKMPGVLSGQY